MSIKLIQRLKLESWGYNIMILASFCDVLVTKIVLLFLPLYIGGYLLRKQMLDDRRFPKMHLDLQRLLQVNFSHLLD